LTVRTWRPRFSPSEGENQLDTLPSIVEQAASLPMLVDRAVKALTNARTAAEVLEARDMASVVYDAAKTAARISRAKGAHDDLVAAAYRTQAHALEIEALAKRRLADEYDAAQERGEVAGGDFKGNQWSVPDENSPPSADDLGLSRKDIHEARLIRDAEKTEPGIVRRTLDAALEAGEEPSKAKVRRAVFQTARPKTAEPAKPTRGKDAVCQRVRDAIVALSGLPEAHEVAGYFRDTDAAIIVSEKLPEVREWIEQFAAAWKE